MVSTLGRLILTLNLATTFEIYFGQLCFIAQDGHLQKDNLRVTLVSLHMSNITTTDVIFTASISSSGWSPPDQLPMSPAANSMCVDSDDQHTLPMVESLAPRESQDDWYSQDASSSTEWDPPSLPPMPTPYRGYDRGTPIPQSSSDSPCETGPSDDSHGWTPPTQAPTQIEATQGRT